MQSDLKIRVRETFGRGGTTSFVHYYKEHFWRIESPGGGGYMIVDWANKRSLSVDPAKRQYVLHSPTRGPEATDSTEMIVVEIETRDTGEEREMFGHAAHRFMTSAGTLSPATGRRQISQKSLPMGGISTFRVHFQFSAVSVRSMSSPYAPANKTSPRSRM